MSALQNCGIPFSRARVQTHRHTHSLCEVLSVKAGYFVLSTFDCRFHGGLVKSASFAAKNCNKQRKLETRQSFWGTADVHREILCPQCSRETYTNENSLLTTASQFPLELPFWDTFHPPSICPWVGCPDLSPGERKWNRDGCVGWSLIAPHYCTSRKNAFEMTSFIRLKQQDHYCCVVHRGGICGFHCEFKREVFKNDKYYSKLSTAEGLMYSFLRLMCLLVLRYANICSEGP